MDKKPSLTERVRKLPSYLHLSDVQGLGQLATQGVLGVTGLAEKVHGNVYKTVAAPFGLLGSRFVDSTQGSTGVKAGGITSFVYSGVRAVTRLAGGTVNAALMQATPFVAKRLGTPKSSPEREAVLSAINGVLGDQLRATANPLAISMSLRHHGEPLVLDRLVLQQRLPKASGKLLVVVHGLCMNDLQWAKSDKNEGSYNHAELIAKELGYTPVYLHYNSGLHISTNGQLFADVLEQLSNAWPQPVQDMSLLAHSMGGLISRSACYLAEQAELAWRDKLKNIVFLGTPHHGAPLERIGNWVDIVLGSHVVSRPFAAIGQIRSSGITDLRYGHVLESSRYKNGLELNRFERSPDSREPLTLPAGVNCFACAATTSAEFGSGKDSFAGDGLVPLESALGQHNEAAHCLNFEPDKQWITYSTNHLALLSRPMVGAQILKWLA